ACGAPDPGQVFGASPGTVSPNRSDSKPPGSVFAIVADSTEGSAPTRVASSRANTGAVASLKPAIVKSTVASSTPCDSKPGLSAPARCSARTNSPAETTRTMLEASCATTNALRSRDRPASIGPADFNTPPTSVLDDCSAGARPENSAAVSDSPV